MILNPSLLNNLPLDGLGRGLHSVGATWSRLGAFFLFARCNAGGTSRDVSRAMSQQAQKKKTQPQQEVTEAKHRGDGQSRATTRSRAQGPPEKWRFWKKRATKDAKHVEQIYTQGEREDRENAKERRNVNITWFFIKPAKPGKEEHMPKGQIIKRKMADIWSCLVMPMRGKWTKH